MRLLQDFSDPDPSFGGLQDYPFAVEHSGHVYPDPRWRDTGLAVLGMWLCATRELLAGVPSATLPFMEGPFSLEVSRLDYGEVLVQLKGEDTRWTLGLVPLARAVLVGAEEAHAAFASDPGSAKELRGWDGVMRTLRRRLP